MTISINRKIEPVGYINTMTGRTYNSLRAGGE